MWNIFWDNSTNELHAVYQVEQDGQRLLGQDVRSILTHINDQEMTSILQANVSVKAERKYNIINKYIITITLIIYK